jgi:PAT family beta-lactamase induction signal transducer AmpG
MAFYQRPDGGFTLTEIGTLQKALGFVGTLIGAGLGGLLVPRYGLWRMLIVFGALQAATNLLYAWLAVAGHDYGVFGAAVFCDQLANAAGTGAFVAYLMSLCSPTVSATQYALLTSLSSVGQRVFGPLAGHVQHAVGWSGFFVVSSLLALPGLAMAVTMSRRPPPPGSPRETSPSDAA